MTRRPPSILSIASTAEGGLEVKWEVDKFFEDSAPPERVLIDLNGAPFKELDGDEDSVEIPVATITSLGAQVIAISVYFGGRDHRRRNNRVLCQFRLGRVAGRGKYRSISS